MTMEVNGQSIETDEEGYLANRTDWTEEVAKEMARLDSCDLSENHWEVLNFLREYYEEYQIAPAVRVLTKAIGKKLGAARETASTCTSCSPTAPPSRPASTRGCPSRPAASRAHVAGTWSERCRR